MGGACLSGDPDEVHLKGMQCERGLLIVITMETNDAIIRSRKEHCLFISSYFVSYFLYRVDKDSRDKIDKIRILTPGLDTLIRVLLNLALGRFDAPRIFGRGWVVYG